MCLIEPCGAPESVISHFKPRAPPLEGVADCLVKVSLSEA